LPSFSLDEFANPAFHVNAVANVHVVLDPVGARAAQDRDGKAKTGKGTTHPRAGARFSHADPQPVLH
jgi:hypothetical protein